MGMKRGFLTASVVIAALTLSACARAPGSISPLKASYDPYREWSCGQLNQAQDDLNSNLAALSRKQRVAHSADLVTLFITGLPVSWIFRGNKGKKIAKVKGELITVETVSFVRDCWREESVLAQVADAS